LGPRERPESVQPSGSDTVTLSKPSKQPPSKSAVTAPEESIVVVPNPNSGKPATAALEPVGLQRLREALQSLGINTTGLNISYSEETVGYPGGSYVNRLISVTGNGKTEHFCAELTARNPMVTATEMRSYFNV
jgi:hypothetical protein